MVGSWLLEGGSLVVTPKARLLFNIVALGMMLLELLGVSTRLGSGSLELGRVGVCGRIGVAGAGWDLAADALV